MSLITKYPDVTKLKQVLAEQLWDAMQSALSSDELGLISSLEPTCNEGAEGISRKLLGLQTVSNILYLRTTVGDETIEDVLTELNVNAC